MNYLKFVAMPLVVVTLVACGGGGGGGSSGGNTVIAPPSSSTQYTITTSVSSGGTITPQQLTVAANSTATFTINPAEGFRVMDVSGCAGSLSGTVFTISAATTSCVVTARFERLTYTVTHRITRGSVVTTSQQTVDHGASVTYDVSDLQWYRTVMGGTCSGRHDGGRYVIDSVKAACDVDQRYELVNAPSSIKPAVGFARGDYQVKSGDDVTVPVYVNGFVPGTTVSVQQVDGPTTTATVTLNTLTLKAPAVDATTTLTYRVSASNPNGGTASRSIVFKVYPRIVGVTTTHGSTVDGLGVDMVITGDGFTSSEQSKIAQEAAKFSNVFFAEPTIAKHRAFWNVHVVNAESRTSGITGGTANVASNDSAFGSFYNCDGIDRFVCTNQGKLLGYSAEKVPQYDQVLLVVNDTKYGGGGFWSSGISTFSLAPRAMDIAIHELGHSFALLADEYDTGTCSKDTEPKHANITIERTAANAKWKHWYQDANNIPTNGSQVANDTVGHFEGGGYCAMGIWRSTFNSVMRTLGMPFGAVNAEQWALSVYRDSGVVRGQFPTTTEVKLSTDQGSVFTVDTYADATVQRVQWYFNDQLLDSRLSDGKTLYVPPQVSDFTVKAVVEDVTGLIRKDPDQLSSKTIQWRGVITAQGE